MKNLKNIDWEKIDSDALLPKEKKELRKQRSKPKKGEGSDLPDQQQRK